VSGDDALPRACVLAERLAGVPVGGMRPGMGCPLSVPQWTTGADWDSLVGGACGLGGCGCQSSPCSSGVHSWRSSRRGVEAASHSGMGLHRLASGLERGSRIRAR